MENLAGNIEKSKELKKKQVSSKSIITISHTVFFPMSEKLEFCWIFYLFFVCLFVFSVFLSVVFILTCDTQESFG